MSLGFEGFGSNLEVHEQFDRDGLSMRALDRIEALAYGLTRLVFWFWECIVLFTDRVRYFGYDWFVGSKVRISGSTEGSHWFVRVDACEGRGL